MFSFIFQSFKILVIWVIIGVSASYLFGKARPYFEQLKNSYYSDSSSKSAKSVKAENDYLLEKALKKVKEGSSHIKKTIASIAENPKRKPITKVQKAVQPSNSFVDNSSKENELLQRQMSIISDLMNG